MLQVHPIVKKGLINTEAIYETLNFYFSEDTESSLVTWKEVVKASANVQRILIG